MKVFRPDPHFTFLSNKKLRAHMIKAHIVRDNKIFVPDIFMTPSQLTIIIIIKIWYVTFYVLFIIPNCFFMFLCHEILTLKLIVCPPVEGRYDQNYDVRCYSLKVKEYLPYCSCFEFISICCWYVENTCKCTVIRFCHLFFWQILQLLFLQFYTNIISIN